MCHLVVVCNGRGLLTFLVCFSSDTGNASYGFGDGLSYSSFAYELVTPSTVHVAALALEEYAAVASQRHVFRRGTDLAKSNSATQTVVVKVTNMGDRAGAHAVLAMMSPPHPGQVRLSQCSKFCLLASDSAASRRFARCTSCSSTRG